MHASDNCKDEELGRSGFGYEPPITLMKAGVTTRG